MDLDKGLNIYRESGGLSVYDFYYMYVMKFPFFRMPRKKGKTGMDHVFNFHLNSNLDSFIQGEESRAYNSQNRD